MGNKEASKNIKGKQGRKKRWRRKGREGQGGKQLRNENKALEGGRKRKKKEE